MRLTALTLAAVFLGVSAPAAFAQPDTPAAAAFCANCHGTEGRQSGAIPAIASRPQALIAAQLRDYRSDKTPQATVMPRLIKGLTDQEIDAVAKYFSELR
jgi:Cytochrome c553